MGLSEFKMWEVVVAWEFLDGGGVATLAKAWERGCLEEASLVVTGVRFFASVKKEH